MSAARRDSDQVRFGQTNALWSGRQTPYRDQNQVFKERNLTMLSEKHTRTDPNVLLAHDGNL